MFLKNYKSIFSEMSWDKSVKFIKKPTLENDDEIHYIIEGDKNLIKFDKLDKRIYRKLKNENINSSLDIDKFDIKIIIIIKAGENYNIFFKTIYIIDNLKFDVGYDDVKGFNQSVSIFSSVFQVLKEYIPKLKLENETFSFEGSKNKEGENQRNKIYKNMIKKIGWKIVREKGDEIIFNITGEIDIRPDWLKLAKYKNEKFEIDDNEKVIWKSGTWISGTWENGFFENGTWISGTWENGFFENGTWENGKFKGGGFGFGGKPIWENGVWEDGSWKNGTWIKGKIWSINFETFVESEVNPKEFHDIEKNCKTLKELKGMVLKN